MSKTQTTKKDEEIIETPPTPEVTEEEVEPLIKKDPPQPTGLMEEEKEELAKLRRQFPESAKEALRLKEKVDELEGKLASADEALTEKELKGSIKDYEFMSDEEKLEAKEDYGREKRLRILEAKEKWREEYISLPDDVKSDLAKHGGEDVFKGYACQSGRTGRLIDLARSFLYEKSPTVIPPKPPVVEKKEEVSPVKPGLEQTKGGGEGKPAPVVVNKEGFTLAELEKIRTTDPVRYNKLAREGKLNIIDKK